MNTHKRRNLELLIIFLVCINNIAFATDYDDKDHNKLFLSLIRERNHLIISSTIKEIEESWQEGYIPLTVETINSTANGYTRRQLIALLERNTNVYSNGDFDSLYQWMWQNQEKKLNDYASFKADLYKNIDPRFEKYFKNRNDQTLIRFDEIRWGGVLQDGIPPLRKPKMISAFEADYLKDDNIVFGIEVNGDVRAYPKRILAWHEMFVDNVGGVPLVGVYCTLCGSVILYKTEHNGVKHQMGTSGFLYRSNKLMYDKKTQSLWNTFLGEPVVGPLINKGIALEHMSVVTTTWKAWKERHPNTKVLSLKTGYRRDYGEGVAYKDYFSSDELMFNTPFNDTRLKNKEEVLALRFAEYPDEQLAISTSFLNLRSIYSDKIGDIDFVVLTDRTGANRVYEKGDVNFVSYDGLSTLTDQEGKKWSLSETELQSASQTLKRLPYHRAFWFGWLAAYPKTRLVK